MKKCKHIFKGHAGGVTCMKCGLEMTADEYAEFLNPTEEEQTEEETSKKEGTADE